MNAKEIDARIATLEATIETLTKRIDEFSTKVESIKVRDRGPSSTREMTRHDAWRVMHGDLKDAKHKEAAKALGLSYGQVYSARGEYTFKDVKADEFKIEVAEEASA